MNKPVSMLHVGSIAIITVDNPPVNALSHAVRSGIADAMNEANADDSVNAIVLVCAGRTFFAGADITEFGKPSKHPDLPELLALIDASLKLTIAAIHGTALGGGFETALSCHYRIALDSANVGLPEVNLGLLPGAGGTQRLPRLIGAGKALDMMLTGRPITAPQAEKLGAIDRITNGDLVVAAVAFANELFQSDATLRQVSAFPNPEVEDGFFVEYPNKNPRAFKGFEAPARILHCVDAACGQSFDDGMAIERRLFEECLASTQSSSMLHLFFAERAAAKVPNINTSTTVRTIEEVGIIGAGTMGAGIALACLNAGLRAILLDASEEGLVRGKATIEKLTADMVRKGRIDEAGHDDRLERLTTTLDYASLSNSDLVIEAVFETMAIKKTVFGQLDKVCKLDAILATNTSTLDIDKIAAATKRSQNVIGLHFFSPANVMKLLEIVRGSATSDEVIATSLAFAKTINKIGVVVGNCFGFVGNRMLYGYGRESQFLLLEGAAPEQIDKALTNWGMAMGPNAVGDLAGLDVGYKVRQERTDLPDDPRYYRVATMLAEMGRYGQKTGAGTYRYEEGSRKPVPDPEVQALIEAEAERLGIERREITDEEIIERCIFASVVEGAKILEEGIASKSSDIDVVWNYGYGFPRFRGGPMFYADTVGLDKVLARVEEFAAALEGDYWQAPKLLNQLVGEGKKFSDYQLS